MSTPIKPPGSADGADPTASSESVDSARGEFGAMVEASREGEPDVATVEAGADPALGALEREIATGQTSADQAVEALVQRALANASGLPESQRAALEAQLREALEGDPTLAALRKDLERASKV